MVIKTTKPFEKQKIFVFEVMRIAIAVDSEPGPNRE